MLNINILVFIIKTYSLENMDFKVLVDIVYKLLKLETKDIDELPGVSYILSKSMQFPTTSFLFSKISPEEIVRVVYTVFFMFKGDEYDTAKFKSNELYLVNVTELGDREYKRVTCEECYGDGTVECGECDGDGEVECHYCEGEGEVEGFDGMEDCDYCDGRGRETCNYCFGETDLECSECDGDGEIETYDEYFEVKESHWVLSDESLYRKLETLNTDREYMDEAKLFELLDNTETKGSVLLLSTKQSRDELDYEDLQDEFGYDIDTNDVVILTAGKLEDYKNRLGYYPGGTNTSLVFEG